MEAGSLRFRALVGVLRGRLLTDEPLSRHTSYRIGGPADFYALPKDEEDAAALLRLCESEGIPRFVIGNGTNLLVADAGFRGVVIDPTEAFATVSAEGPVVTAGAGLGLWDLIRFCGARGLSGFETLAGIPGTVGGGVRLNAGAFGAEIKDRLVSVSGVDGRGERTTRNRGALRMEYRRTDLEPGLLLTEARFAFEPGEPAALMKVQEEILSRRGEKQPLSLPSAGSVFKRPPGDYAGRLIEEAGLKGLRIGDAMVSPKHANFVVNLGAARADEVMALIDAVRERVRARSGVTLETEIHFLGFE
jgi:UDP-N-acetylmuramate dehydrogenase